MEDELFELSVVGYVTLVVDASRPVPGSTHYPTATGN